MSGIHLLDAKGPQGVLVCAVGDVHGRLDLLDAMIQRIESLAEEVEANELRIVLLGDYVDRGPDSKGVLDLLVRHRNDPRFVMLGGNHDFGFLEFLDLPRAASLFARHGGVETAASYGVQADFRSDFGVAQTRNALLHAIPGVHIDLLENLRRSASFGDFFFCHAGVRPGVDLDAQDEDDLIWIREEFLEHRGLHPKVVVHGHTPVDVPDMRANRVNVDTCACRSGVLSALAIYNDTKKLVSVEATASR
jgi:serine/threonine protein phosphatase 1